MDEALHIKNTDVAQELALPPVKIHCSVLAEDAIKAAIADFQQQARTSARRQPAARVDDRSPASDDRAASAPGHPASHRDQREGGGADQDPARREGHAGRRPAARRARAAAARASPTTSTGPTGPRELDQVFEKDGARVFVDPKSYLFLERHGASTAQQTLMQTGFVFKNPNVKTACGCGESFTV